MLASSVGSGARGIIGALFAATLVLTAARGDAVEFRNQVGGLGCRQTSATGSYGLFGGTVYNGSTTGSLSLLCPIPMANTTNNTTQNNNSTMMVMDRNSSASVSCTLTGELLASGGLFQFFSTASTTAADNQADPFLKAFPGAVTGWYFYATCTLPPATASGVSHIGLFDIRKI